MNSCFWLFVHCVYLYLTMNYQLWNNLIQCKAAWLSVGMLDPITCLNWIWLVYIVSEIVVSNKLVRFPHCQHLQFLRFPVCMVYMYCTVEDSIYLPFHPKWFVFRYNLLHTSYSLVKEKCSLDTSLGKLRLKFRIKYFVRLSAPVRLLENNLLPRQTLHYIYMYIYMYVPR